MSPEFLDFSEFANRPVLLADACAGLPTDTLIVASRHGPGSLTRLLDAARALLRRERLAGLESSDLAEAVAAFE